MGRVPEYEVISGQMHVTLGEFSVVMPLHVFEIGAARARAAIDRWHEQQHGDVLPFRKSPG
jgi:hypothetical protein